MEEALERVKVSGGTEEQKEIFYTALYHALLHPNVLNDVNGEYPLMQGGKYATQNGIEVVKPGIGKVTKGHNRYTVFSLWDTSRNLHQLLTLAYPEKQIDMVRSMVDMYKEWGWMPKWELYGRETFTMEGDPAIPVIADTYLKDSPILTSKRLIKPASSLPTHRAKTIRFALTWILTSRKATFP